MAVEIKTGHIRTFTVNGIGRLGTDSKNSVTVMLSFKALGDMDYRLLFRHMYRTYEGTPKKALCRSGYRFNCQPRISISFSP